MKDIEELRAKVKANGAREKEEVSKVKNRVHEELQKEILDSLRCGSLYIRRIDRQVSSYFRSQITSEIKSVIEKETKNQVDRQISDHISIPLAKQKEETEGRLSEVKVSLVNSRARIANAAITLEHMNDKLDVLLKKDGERSKIYPADITSLLAYDAKMVRDLLCDYGLESDADLNVNLNRFIHYIGECSSCREQVFSYYSSSGIPQDSRIAIA
ncbi:uncharacterized protein EV420DRAFT_1266819 [Desarmillaria tabescens]|uniref:Uncharacterized protein n=1 Tax=Armillaria tabescens TaxID=1929756 RepID=A0AA39N8D7_ARMTA|nr:uncharacterized protein EV420DRAFT_1266819 [Desarmillaria tabescens]KAK0460914.1 hypothetical protein EV420DRAFT_1266819 [Desarmillaria tabescens]